MGRIRVLLVEDSVADANLVSEVFEEEKITADLTVVRDGEEAMEYLLDPKTLDGTRAPDLIFLDLNLPKKDGRQVLTEIKQHPDLKHIPVVILTTSQNQEDICKSYGLQASCYVTKPLGLEQFTKAVTSINSFWFSVVQFPKHNHYG